MQQRVSGSARVMSSTVAPSRPRAARKSRMALRRGVKNFGWVLGRGARGLCGEGRRTLGFRGALGSSACRQRRHVTSVSVAAVASFPRTRPASIFAPQSVVRESRQRCTRFTRRMGASAMKPIASSPVSSLSRKCHCLTCRCTYSCISRSETVGCSTMSSARSCSRSSERRPARAQYCRSLFRGMRCSRNVATEGTVVAVGSIRISS